MMGARMKQMLQRSVVPAEIQQLIPQYVAGQLSTEETQALEEYCILHPEAAAEIETERMLKAAFLAVHQAREALSAAAKMPVPGTPRASPIWARWGRALAIAATLAAVLFGLRVALTTRSGGPLSAMAPGAVTAMRTVPKLVLLTLRGSTPVLQIGVSDSRASIELQPDVSRANAHYELALDRLDADDQWQQLGQLRTVADAANGSVHFMLSVSALAEGRLRVVARDLDAGTPPVSFEFVLRCAATTCGAALP